MYQHIVYAGRGMKLCLTYCNTTRDSRGGGGDTE